MGRGGWSRRTGRTATCAAGRGRGGLGSTPQTGRRGGVRLADAGASRPVATMRLRSDSHASASFQCVKVRSATMTPWFFTFTRYRPCLVFKITTPTPIQVACLAPELAPEAPPWRTRRNSTGPSRPLESALAPLPVSTPRHRSVPRIRLSGVPLWLLLWQMGRRFAALRCRCT